MEQAVSGSFEELKKSLISGIRSQWDVPEVRQCDLRFEKTLAYSWRSHVMLASVASSASSIKKLVVVKTFNENLLHKIIDDDEKRDRLILYCEREAAIWRKTGNNPNIGEVIGITESFNGGKLPATVYPYHPLRDVRRFVTDNEVDIGQRISLMRDVANALKFLHALTPQVVHRDVRGSNVLVKKSDKCFVACLSDFGSAKLLDRTGIDMAETSTRTSLQWTPPEYIEGDRLCYNNATPFGDMWSFGCTMLEIEQKEDPWAGMTEVFERLKAGMRPPKPKYVQIDCRLWSLMESCWELEPRRRLDADGMSMFLGKLMSADDIHRILTRN